MSKTIFDKNLIYSDNRYEAYRNYWDSIVTNGVGAVDLPFPQKGKTGENITSVEKCTISTEAATYIRKTAKGNCMGMFAIMLSAFKVINYKCSTKESTVISYLSPSLAGTMDVDYVILQSTINESETLKDTITNTASAIATAYKFQDYPLPLVDDRFADAEFDITELINVGFSFIGLHNDFTPNGRPDIHFQIADISENSLEISLAANTKFIDAQDALTLLHNYVSFLDRIAVLMNQTINDIILIDNVQSAFMREQFTVDSLKMSTVKELFEKVALDYREKTAVVFENISLTYNQLNSSANRLAVDMTEQGVTSGDKVLILMEMSIYVPIAMLACIKLGVPYIPLDVDTPSDRISYIIEDSGAKFVISSLSQNDFVSQLSIKVFEIEYYKQMNEISDPKADLNGDNPLYIIYTSGTTGKPKGVVVNNRNMVNYVNWFTAFARVTDRDKAMLVSSFSFDLGYTSVYSSLLNGAELHLLSKEQYSNVPYMLEYIDKQSITFFKLTPSLFSLLKTDSNFVNYNLSSLRLVILGGEKLRIEDIIGFKASYKNCEFVNHYGPTETTIGTIAKYISEAEYATFEEHSILGKAITNNEVYILSSSNEIMPIGTLGEIVVGGLGVSDGYLHRKELNAEKFITLPELTKSVLYKTGDLGRLLPTGEFEFFGRIDNQVKIRGYRVELDEVKQAIKKYEGITDVIITTYNRNSNISLCAYYVSDREIVAKLLREYLSTQLPDYMIPTYFTSIDKIPVTLNGKVDFKALPEPSIDLSDREIVLPRNDTEKRLAAVWQDVLGISENLSIDDNFFDLGGDSILAIQISSTAKSEGLNIEVKDIMQNPTIRELGVIAKVDTRQNVISQEPIMGEVQLSPIQKRFFERLGALNHWNQSIVLHSRKPVDTHLLKNAFEILLDRHDMLRAVYTEADHRFEQSVGNPQDKESMYRFMVINVETEITSTIIEEKGNELQSSLDITNGLIAVFAVIQNNKEQYILMIIHHLVVDGVSWRIIASDFDAICRGGIDNLPLKTNTYQDWVKWMKDNEIQFRKDTDYWNSMPEIAGMTDNYPSKNGIYKDTQTQSVMIDVDTTKAILTTANHAYNTKTDELLITAFLVSINQVWQYPTVVINLEGHGRDTFGTGLDISQTVGWFTCVYPFAFSFKGITTKENAIKHIKEKLRNIPHNGISYGFLRYLSDIPVKTVDSSICFNYLGQFDNSFDTTCFDYPNYSAGQAIGDEADQQYGLHLNLAVTNGILRVNATYSKKIFTDENITILLNAFKTNVTDIVNMCLSATESTPTPSDFPYAEMSIAELDRIVEKYKTLDGKSNIENIYPLIPFQEVMYYEATTYNNAIQPYYHSRIFDINTSVNLAIMQNAVDMMVRKYETLRMAIEELDNGRHVTVIKRDAPIKVEYDDISKMSLDEQEQYFEAFRISDTVNSFATNNFMRIFLLKRSDSAYRVLWSNSHLIIDGWSRMIILKDFLQTLQSLKMNQVVVESVAHSFYDYVKWLYTQDFEAAKQYWDAYMSGYTPKCLFGDIPPISDGVYTLREYAINIDDEKTNALNTIARVNNITVGVIVQCAIGLALQKICNTDDIVFGGVVSGRTTAIENIDNMVGPFINIIPFRVNSSGFSSFIELAKQRHNTSLDADVHSFCYYTEPTSMSDFVSLVAFENYPVDDSVRSTFFGGGLISNLKLMDRVGTNAVFLVFPEKNITINLVCNAKLISHNQQSSIMQEVERIIVNILDSGGNFPLG